MSLDYHASREMTNQVSFASQALMSCRTLNLDMSKVNPKGGAIAFGRSLPCCASQKLSADE